MKVVTEHAWLRRCIVVSILILGIVLMPWIEALACSLQGCDSVVANGNCVIVDEHTSSCTAGGTSCTITGSACFIIDSVCCLYDASCTLFRTVRRTITISHCTSSTTQVLTLPKLKCKVSPPPVTCINDNRECNNYTASVGCGACGDGGGDPVGDVVVEYSVVGTTHVLVHDHMRCQA